MDTSKIKNYDKIVGIFRNGLLTRGQHDCAGTAPIRSGFPLARTAPRFRAMKSPGLDDLIPTIYNADTLGIRTRSDRASPSPIGPNWANPEFKSHKLRFLRYFPLLGSMTWPWSVEVDGRI